MLSNLCRHIRIDDSPVFLLSHLEKSEYIDERNFEHVFYEPATTALPKIEELLKDWKKQK